MRKVSTVILNPFITVHLVFTHGNLEAFFHLSLKLLWLRLKVQQLLKITMSTFKFSPYLIGINFFFFLQLLPHFITLPIFPMQCYIPLINFSNYRPSPFPLKISFMVLLLNSVTLRKTYLLMIFKALLINQAFLFIAIL